MEWEYIAWMTVNSLCIIGYYFYWENQYKIWNKNFDLILEHLNKNIVNTNALTTYQAEIGQRLLALEELASPGFTPKVDKDD